MYTHTLHIKQIKECSEIVKQAKWDTWGINHTALHVYEQHSLSRTTPKQVLIKQKGEVKVVNARLTVPIKWEREKSCDERQENHRSQAGPVSWNIQCSRRSQSLALATLRPETFQGVLMLGKARRTVYILCLDSHLEVQGLSVNTVSGCLHDLRSQITGHIHLKRCSNRTFIIHPSHH